MKNINWYKFTIVTFSIWFINKITSIRMGSFTPYFVSMVLFLILLATTASCSSHCAQTKRYWRNHRCVDTPKINKAPCRARRSLDRKLRASQSQYAFENN